MQPKPTLLSKARAFGLLAVLGLTSACRTEAVSSDAAGNAQAAHPRGSAFLRFERDVALEYALSLGSQLSFGSAGGDVDVSLQAKLRVISLTPASDMPPGTEALSVVLEQVRLTSTQAAPASFAELTRELEAGFLTELRAGSLVTLRMAQPSAFAASLARTIAAELARGAAPSVGAERWEASASDATGSFTAEYRALESKGQYRARKLRYAPSKLGSVPGSSQELSLTPEVLESNGELWVTAGVLQRLTYAEKLRTRLLGSGEARAATSITLELVGRSKVGVGPGHAELRARMSDVAAAEQAAPRVDAAAFDHSKIGDFTFDTASSQLLELSRGPALLRGTDAKGESEPERRARELRLADFNRAFSALTAIVRTEPGSVERATQGARADTERASFLIDALTGAGSDAAQAALVQLAEDTAAAEDVRTRARQSVIRIDAPTPQTVSALIGWLKRPEQRVYAMYGLGTYARRLRELGRTELSHRASQVLGEELHASRGTTERVHLLRGIANSGEPALLTKVRPLVTDRDAVVRGAALEALRLMDAPEVDGIIAERLGVEQSYEALREPSATLVQALSAAAQSSADSQTRYRATSLLATWLPKRPELRSLLSGLAEHDENEEVRGAAARALQPT